MRVCVQTWIMKEFPEVMVIATISCSFVVALSAIVAFVVERDNPQAWIVKPDMELAAILYSVNLYSITKRYLISGFTYTST